MAEEAEAEYHSKDFEWEDLRRVVENDSSLRYHLTPFVSSSSCAAPAMEADAWRSFHRRHSAGKFFKVLIINSTLGHKKIEVFLFDDGFTTEMTKARDIAELYLLMMMKFMCCRKKMVPNKTDILCLDYLYVLCLRFKERRYLLKEFPELIRISDSVKVLEVGCGNGSTVLPILRAKQNITVYACDCSEEILRKAEEIIATGSAISLVPRFFTFLLDVSVNDFPDWLFCTSCRRNSSPEPANFSSDSRGENLEMSHMSAFLREDQCCIGGVDFVTMIFTLSAIPFKRMPSVIEKCLSVLRPGGLLLFRDYGLYDMTMLRFLSEQRVGFCEYMRSDGTFSYFFSLDTARNLFLAAGFTEVELTYCCITSVNRQKGKSMQRVWVHGKFQKPV
ncbi:hypothetical protein ZIOFF_010360 [Zingiber officinale]|uniref:Methyltransferase-like protein n=1 Tax=Zingiber officinale TaxID=94328 RepID=A0A8J5HM08_ZINOF|nr:hypothetical protein ZIOFF_010360 [Zingiber officinale]